LGLARRLQAARVERRVGLPPEPAEGRLHARAVPAHGARHRGDQRELRRGEPGVQVRLAAAHAQVHQLAAGHVHALVHPGEGLEPVHGAGDKQRHLATRGPGRGRADVVPEGAERLELGGQGPGDVLGADGVEEGVRAGSGGGGGGHDGGGHDGVCSKRGVRGESRARGARAFSGGGRQWGERGENRARRAGR
ncbi:hypothetical protein EG878_17300, partial [Enterococcus faecalis]